MRFAEYMDVGNRNEWRQDLVVPSKELAATNCRALASASRWSAGYRGEVAERYEFLDGQGEVGFISSVTQPFCGDCSRARLSSDGVIYTCLFATKGTSLRETIPARRGQRRAATRHHAQHLAATLRPVQRAARDSAQDLNTASERKVEMFYIGG